MSKKSGLGRGLESLLGETAGEVGPDADGVSYVSIDEIQVNPDQPRKDFDPEQLQELADSISRNGVLQPVLLRPREGGYQIVAGERRYQAARLAQLSEIPAVIRDIDDDQVLVLAMIENLQRSDLNAMEEARGYRTLMEQNGFTQQQLSEAVSKSRSAVANILRLLDLPDEVQELVADGKLTAGHARAILGVQGESDRIALAQKVVREGLSVRQTEKLASMVSGRKPVQKSGAVLRPASYVTAEHQLHETLGTKVDVRSVRGKNKIEIEFDDEEQLEDLVSRLCS